MSNAQWPPDSSAEVKIPLQRFSARLGSLGDGQVEDLPGRANSAIDGDSAEVALGSPAEDAQTALALAVVPGEPQENLDPQLPDEHQPALGEVITLPHVPPQPLDAAPSSGDHEPEQFDSEPPPVRSDAEENAPAAQDEAVTAVSPYATEAPLEVSPIFTALDAEENAAAAPPPDHGPTLDAPDADLPLSPPFALIETNENGIVSVVPQSASGETAIDTSDNDANPATADANATAAETHAPTPELDTVTGAEQAPPPEALQEAAARIAAEANATAVALENLKRLLANKAVVPAAAEVHETGPERTEPPPLPIYRAPVQLPVTPPPMVAMPLAAASLSTFEDDVAPPYRRRGAAVGSFLAGFALSWVFGAVLYVYLTAG
jgi:hypothetical protein